MEALINFQNRFRGFGNIPFFQCVLFENLKSDPRERSTGQTERTLADHKLKEMERPAHDVRRPCVGCYERIRQQRSREVSAASVKKIKTFYPDCDIFY